MLRSTLFAMSIAAVSAGAVAHPVTITPTKHDLPTITCFVAAKDGLKSANAFLEKHDSSLLEFRQRYVCNGEDIVKFTKRIERKKKQRDSQAWYARELGF